jgi:hypothetical protein
MSRRAATPTNSPSSSKYAVGNGDDVAGDVKEKGSNEFVTGAPI